MLKSFLYKHYNFASCAFSHLCFALCCRGVGGEAIIWQVSGGAPEY